MPSRVVISFRRPAISWVRAAPSTTHGPAIRNSGRPAPTSCPVSCTGSRARRLRQLRCALRARSPDETGEQLVAVAWGGGELRVELRRHEPRMVGQLDHLHQPVARDPREAHARLPVAVEVVVVEFVAVPMALHDVVAPEDRARPRAGPEQHLLGSQAHGAALGAGLVAGLRAVHLVLPLGDEGNHRVRAGTVELGTVGIRKPQYVTAEFHDRHLHAEADPQVRHTLLARVAHRLDLALDAALAEAAGHQDRVHALEHVGAALLDIGGFDVVDIDARAALQPAVHQRLVQRQIGIADLHVLADHGDVHLAVGIGPGAHHLAPLGQIGGRYLQAQLVDDDVIERLLMQQDRDPVDVVRVDRGNHRPLFHIGKQGNLAPLLLGQWMLAAAQQHVRLDADAAQLLHRVLRRLGLDLTRAPHYRHQRQVHERAVVAAELDTELADGLEERQRLDVTDGAADLDHADIRAVGAQLDAALDLIGDVRDDLHSGAEVIAAALLVDD